MTRAEPCSLRWLAAALLTLSTATAVQAQQRPASSYVNVEWGAGCGREHRCTLAAGDTAAVLYLTSVMNVMEELDSQFVRLPEGLTVELGRCGEASAFYTPAIRTITMCVELYASLYDEMRHAFANIPEYQSPRVVFNMAMFAGEFLFLHELSHALIHLWDLPITGNEEEASDQFASWITIRGEDKRRFPAAAIAYRRWAVPERVAEAMGHIRPYGTIHPNMYDRELNLGCWGQGATGAGLRADRLPATRLAQCGEEWARISRSWTTLLRPHLKSR